MPVTALSAPPARPAGFPPPSTPLRFCHDDRYEQADAGAWQRAPGGGPDGRWEPQTGSEAGWLADDDVRYLLQRSAVRGEVGHRFVPRPPGAFLPGARIDSPSGLKRLDFGPARSAAQYLMDHQENRLVPLPDLIALYDENAAYDFAATLPLDEMADVLATILAEQQRPRVSYEESAGRLYARYERTLGADAPGYRFTFECLHVFVLSTAPAGG
ncbi:hypothetical protein [Streptomyces sp. 7N604]|uniref:hypothetical protein n=1 Tax=Streptomyces sp. 7N604 TaxID=3457415 RepID=UPI003FCF259E